MQTDNGIRTETRTDSVRRNRTDSIVTAVSDSIVIRDSVHVIEHADGTRDTYRYRDRYRSTTRDASKTAMDSVQERVACSVADTSRSILVHEEKAGKTTKRTSRLPFAILTAAIISLIAASSVFLNVYRRK